MSAFELEHRTCPVCGSADDSSLFAEARFDPARLDALSFSSRKAPEGMHYRLLECGPCDLLYASPVPAHDAVVDAYRAADYESGEEAEYAARTYARLLANVLPNLPDHRGAVDIGAGDGAFLERLLAAGFGQVVGFEPSAAPVAAARPGLRRHIRPEPFVAGVLPESSFSLVTCLQTIEHVPDPLAVCTDALRALVPSGAMVIVCHNRRALSAKVLGRRSSIFDIEHLQLFSPQSIRKLLERSGFERISVSSLSNRYPLGYWLRLAPLPRRARSIVTAVLSAARVDNIPVSLSAGNLCVVAHKSAEAA